MGPARVVAAVLAIGACGRVQFDPLGDGGSDALGPDAPVQMLTFGERPDSLVQNVTRDAPALSAVPNLNYGARPTFAINGSASPENSFLRFDLSMLAPGTTVVRARLVLDIFDSGDIVAGTLECLRVDEDWVEGEGDGETVAGMTWQVRGNGMPWSTLGGTASEFMGSIDLGTDPGPIEIELAPAVVQDWIASPATNFGLMMRTSGESGHWHPSTREAADPLTRPQLELAITAP